MDLLLCILHEFVIFSPREAVKKNKEWPDSMKNWVRLSFQECDNERSKDKLEKKLRTFITRVLNDGSAWTINWSLKPLFW